MERGLEDRLGGVAHEPEGLWRLWSVRGRAAGGGFKLALSRIVHPLLESKLREVWRSREHTSACPPRRAIAPFWPFAFVHFVCSYFFFAETQMVVCLTHSAFSRFYLYVSFQCCLFVIGMKQPSCTNPTPATPPPSSWFTPALFAVPPSFPDTFSGRYQ